MQIKSITANHLILVRMAIIENSKTTNAGEGIEKREPSCAVGGNVNWCSYYGKEYGGYSEN